jgi:UDP-glucuronate 4-epimerase
MAYYKFTEMIARGEPIEVYGQGRMARDFTYIDDIIDGVIGVLDAPPARNAHEIFNIGDSQPVGLMDMIASLEEALGMKADKIMRPMQPGDVTATYADISRLNAKIGYKPKVMLTEGLQRYVAWWRSYKGRTA